jgi:hypothetical protein
MMPGIVRARFLAPSVAVASFAVAVFGGTVAHAQTAADVAADVNKMCAVMSGQQKPDSQTLQYFRLND